MTRLIRAFALAALTAIGADRALGQTEVYQLSGPQFFSGRIAMDDGVLLMREGAFSVKLRDARTGTVLHSLFAGTGNVGENFGFSIDIDEGLAVVGGPGSLSTTPSQAAYVFDVASGSLMHRLTPPAGAPGDFFGQSVSLSNGRVLVGAPGTDSSAGIDSGAVYLYDAMTGQFLGGLTPNTLVDYQGFGSAVDLDGDRALVGGSGSTNFASGPVGGRGYLFDVASGQELHEFAFQFRVRAVALNSPFALVSSTAGSVPGNFGIIRVFDVASGLEQAPIMAPTPSFSDDFGDSMDIDGTWLMTGTEDSSHAGRALVIDLVTRNILFEFESFQTGHFADNFGGESALDGNFCVVGAITNTVNGGAAYAYDLDDIGLTICDQDPNSTGYGARLAVGGSTSLSAQSLELRSTRVPENRPGVFFGGPSLVQVPLGDGIRCAGGNLVRLSQPTISLGGQLQAEVDFGLQGALIPTGTFYFQTWYRDTIPGGTGSNLSEAVEATLVP